MGYHATLEASAYPETEVEPLVISEDKDDTWYGFYGASVDNHGEVNVLDNYAFFGDAEKFAKLLATKMKKGRIQLHFVGDEGDHYGYIVEPNAVVEYVGDGHPAAYYLPGGKELFIELLKEEREELLERIRHIEDMLKFTQEEQR